MRALLIQCVSFFIVAAVLLAVVRLTQFPIILAVAALAQGSLAAALSYWQRLARWWLVIQWLFPIALLGMLALHLPSTLFLILFVFFLTLYWSTFRTQVPFYPSGPAVWTTVSRMLQAMPPVRVVDIGSGLGGLILDLARRHPESTFTGVELAPLPWLFSMVRARLSGSAGKFIRHDYDDLDFAEYDVVFAYLSPAAMPALWKKAHTEMRTGTLLLSYEFPIPDHKPDIIASPSGDSVALYGWRM